MKIIVGLGNPGDEYEATRHNVGFRVVDRLSSRFGGNFKKARFKSVESSIDIDGSKLVLVKPSTYMNLSGEAVSGAIRFYKRKADSLLVIHDDLDLPLGRLKFSHASSAGGHHGVESIIEHLGTQHFSRLRFGIGKPMRSGQTVDYVLSSFKEEESKILEEAIDQAAEAVLYFIKNGIQAAMNYYNSLKTK